ncbi:MAG: hypothetical protein HOP02_05500 [Methylococcaceae bacterium]|nr:hypothetical protein [Methylococcaceae bacterium]
MSTEQYLHGNLAKILVRTQAILALLILLLLAGLDFFFPTNYSLQAGLHGVSAISAIVAGTYLTHRAYALIRGVHVNFKSLRYWVLGSTALNFLGAVSGNWIYMRYRGENGPRDWILKNAPDFHNYMMEFKEFVTLFPFPLMAAVTFILFYYGDDIHVRRDLTQFVGITILVSWLFLLIGFVTGLVLAKLHFV